MSAPTLERVKRLNQKSITRAKIRRPREGMPKIAILGSLSITATNSAMAMAVQRIMSGCEPAETVEFPSFHRIESPICPTLKKWIITKLSPARRSDSKRKILVRLAEPTDCPLAAEVDSGNELPPWKRLTSRYSILLADRGHHRQVRTSCRSLENCLTPDKSRNRKLRNSLFRQARLPGSPIMMYPCAFPASPSSAIKIVNLFEKLCLNSPPPPSTGQSRQS
jgi:hypothetical protein